jgi:hypothetical protein
MIRMATYQVKDDAIQANCQYKVLYKVAQPAEGAQRPDSADVSSLMRAGTSPRRLSMAALSSDQLAVQIVTVNQKDRFEQRQVRK